MCYCGGYNNKMDRLALAGTFNGESCDAEFTLANLETMMIFFVHEPAASAAQSQQIPR